MRICHLTSAHTLDDTRILHKECQSLAKFGHEVFLVGFGVSEFKSGVNIVGLDSKPQNRLNRIISGARRVIKAGLKLDCDVYHLHDPELIPYIPLLRQKNKKVIFDSHEDIPAQIYEKDWLPLKSVVSSIYSIIENFFLKRASALIFVTPSMEPRLTDINPKSVLITNYPIVDSSMVQQNDVIHDDYLCFAGGIMEKWNHGSVIKALQKVDGVSYRVYGKPSPPDYLEYLKNIDTKGVLDYRGVIAHSEVMPFYQKALAGICWLIPSPNVGGSEGTLGNNKLFEQMLAGIPVIISNLRLWREIIEENDCGIVVNDSDLDGFVEAVNFLKQNPEKAKTMGENGRRAVLTKYNWTTQEEVLINLYDSI